MISRRRLGPRRLLGALPLVLALAGCGLSDYAGQMSSEATRVAAWDEEMKLLGPPITLPVLPKKDDKEQHWTAFIRLPAGVSATPKLAANSTLAELSGPLAKYDGNTYVSGFVNVYVGVVNGEQKDFVGSVYNQFPGASPGGEAIVTVARSRIVGSWLPSTFNVRQKVVEVAPYAYSFNFYENGKDQGAVVYQMDKGNVARNDPAIKASLATLGITDTEVTRLGGLYSTRRPVRK